MAKYTSADLGLEDTDVDIFEFELDGDAGTITFCPLDELAVEDIDLFMQADQGTVNPKDMIQAWLSEEDYAKTVKAGLKLGHMAALFKLVSKHYESNLGDEGKE